MDVSWQKNDFLYTVTRHLGVSWWRHNQKRPVTLGPLNFVLYKRGCVKLKLENVSLATASEDTIKAF